MNHTPQCGTAEIVTELALGKVNSFHCRLGGELMNSVLKSLSRAGWDLERTRDDRVDCPSDFCYLASLLRVSSDLEVGLGACHSLGGHSWTWNLHAKAARTLSSEVKMSPGRASGRT